MRMTEIVGMPRSYDVGTMQPKKVIEDISVQPDNKTPDSPDYSPNELTLDKSRDLRRTITDFDNISLTFNKEETFDYIGSESSLANLDMQKAISDMRRDKIFEEYQYFVGSKPDLEIGGEVDGTVVLKK